MYDSIIFRSVARLMLPLLLLLSLFALVRGHNLPGGGFIGGLLAASGVIMQIVAFGPERAHAFFPVDFLKLAGVGVLFATAWGLLGVAFGQVYLQPFWLPQPIPGIGKIGTPLLFDIGVYLAVIGVTAQLAFVIAEEPGNYPLAQQSGANRLADEA